MNRTFLTALCSALLALPAQAIMDTDLDGMSDEWESIHGFHIGANPPANQLPTADPDGDGWTNIQEATAGTKPFDANAPQGFLAPDVERIPGDDTTVPPTPDAYKFTWPTFIGKTYQLFCSQDLEPGSWQPASENYLGDGDDITYDAQVLNSDGTLPEKIFWRVKTEDTDSDGDDLTNWEEARLDLNPFSKDTDKDGIFDKADGNPGSFANPSTATSATYADPDWRGLVNAGLLTGLRANWDFEETVFPQSTLAGKLGLIARNRVSPLPAPWPMLLPFTIPAARPGFISNGLPLGNLPAYGDGKIFNGITASFTLSFWHRFEKDSIKNGNSIYKCLWSLADSKPATNNIQSNTLAIRRKNATQEEIYLGAYTWDNNGGNPSSTIPGKSITRPIGTADDGNWHHYTILRVNGKYTLLIDGQPLPGLDNESVTWLSIPFSAITPTSPTDFNYVWNTFGRMAPSVSQNQTSGTFDRIRLWDHALAPADALKLYRENTDSDGLWDITEVRSELWRDNNSNAIRDSGETTYRSHPLEWQDDTADTDGDGLSDKYEQDISLTDIANPDSDGDLLPDGWEVDNALDPLVPNATDTDQSGELEPDEYTNSDTDPLTDIEEYENQTDPTEADTDGDGVNDDIEIAQFSDPNDPADKDPVPADQRLAINLGIGDKSGSESEDYIMNVFRIDPATGQENPFHTLRSGGFGKYKEKILAKFRKGTTYTFQIDWQDSKLTSRPASPGVTAEGPDFDYTFKVEPRDNPTGPLLLDSIDSKTKTLDTSITLLAEDASDVVETVKEFEKTYEERRVVILAVEVATTTSPHGTSTTPRKVDSLIATWPEDTVSLTVTSNGFPEQILGNLIETTWEAGGGVSPATANGLEITLTGFNENISPVRITANVSGHEMRVWIDVPDVGTDSTNFVALTDPFGAIIALEGALKAESWAEEFPDFNKGNALQHAFWNSWMATADSQFNALIFSSAHEYTNKENGGLAIDSTMDLYNNYIGSTVVHRTLLLFPDEEAIKQDLLNKYNNGLLYIINFYDSVQIEKSNGEKIYPY